MSIAHAKALLILQLNTNTYSNTIVSFLKMHNYNYVAYCFQFALYNYHCMYFVVIYNFGKHVC